jgi:nitrite reductase/ring-hydroxylating ferredoxin subunit
MTGWFPAIESIREDMPEHKFLSAQPGSRVDHVGTYQRVLPVSMDRMFENALDWEHLPFLHSSSFTTIQCEDAGSWGWRARVSDARARESLLELRLDTSQRRWITRTLEGELAGAEIWTYVIERGPRKIEIVIDFHVPGVAAELRDLVGRAYARVYERLYDEDVAMMCSRQNLLDSRIVPIEQDIEPACLGQMKKLVFPLAARFSGSDVVINLLNGTPVIHAARCPHQGAPLISGKVTQNILECPWHGYRFDLGSGQCLSGSGLSMATPFAAWVVHDELWVGMQKNR